MQFIDKWHNRQRPPTITYAHIKNTFFWWNLLFFPHFLYLFIIILSRRGRGWGFRFPENPPVFPSFLPSVSKPLVPLHVHVDCNTSKRTNNKKKKNDNISFQVFTPKNVGFFFLLPSRLPDATSIWFFFSRAHIGEGGGYNTTPVFFWYATHRFLSSKINSLFFLFGHFFSSLSLVL